MLEILVHLEFGNLEDLPDTYQLLTIQFPESITRRELNAEDLPDDWRKRLEVTRAAGDAWLAAGESAVLSIPNAIVPYTASHLINPTHPETAGIRIAAADRVPFDERLFKRRPFSMKFNDGRTVDWGDASQRSPDEALRNPGRSVP